MSIEDPWFAVTAQHPPLRARVRVLWEGRMFAAMRIVHPTQRKIVWATVTDGELEFLPRAKDRKRWGPEPGQWQPEEPGSWAHDLPPPLPRVGAVSAPPARDEGLDREPADTDSFWWRDASAITYSQPGEIGMREAEGRVKRAILTDGLRPEKFARQRGVAWPAELMATAEEIEKWRNGPVAAALVGDRFRPTPQDVDDSLIAMTWFAALDPPALRHKPIRERFLAIQQVLIYRALDPPFTWEQAGAKLNRSRQAARNLHDDAIEGIWNAANGRPAYRHTRSGPGTELEALRRRNRAALRAASRV